MRYLLAVLIFLGFLWPGFIWASEPSQQDKQLEEIIVKGVKIITPTKQPDETVYTGLEVTQKGLEIQGEKAKTNVYEALSIVPGVVFEGIDPYNLTSEQMNVRIRGVRGYLGAMTIEGVPNYGGNPMGPRAYVYDLENFESIAIYKGAVPGDLGSGVGNRAGAIELKPKWAKAESGIEFSQSFGAYDYTRSFIRGDSGSTGPLDTRMSFSFSYTQADKWKGPGDIGPRYNFNTTIVQPLGERLEIDFFGNWNEIQHDKYRYLTYAQARNLETYRRLDFNETTAGKPVDDQNYYKYNREWHRNRDFIVPIRIKPYEVIDITVKPYVIDEDANIRDGVPGGPTGARMQERIRNINKKGVVSEASFESSLFKMALGYHFEAAEMEISSRNWGITPQNTLVYQGIGITGSAGTAYINSPYAKIAGTIDKFDWQVGAKYFSFKDSDSEGYVSDPKDPWRLIRAPDFDREGRTYDVWLPTLGLSYKITESLEVYTSYGKNFIRPYAYVPLVNLYNNNRSKFQSAGITLNDLFKGYDIEESNNVDVGLRLHEGYFEINPTFFYSKHDKLLTTIYDPRVGLNYQQNVGKATGYGIELGTSVYLSDWLTIFANPTYVHLTYDEDIVYRGAVLSTEGKQVTDTPRWTVASGIIAKWKNFEIIPKVRYIGKRYGDAEHKEEVPSYAVFDLKISYTKENLPFISQVKNLGMSLEFDNIFNKKYISLINAMDDALSGSTTYGVGAPFTVKASISLAF
ncbi:MAG: TonB-dependent receptor [Syntrophobacterales bacterium]|nr:TonB-dependent receptor [Syntrophobacterales bacterium]